MAIDDREQKMFIHFLAKELKAYHREVLAYQLVFYLLHESGRSDVREMLEQARKAPAVQTQLEKNFAGFDELLPPADASYEERVKELLAKWKPPGGLIH